MHKRLCRFAVRGLGAELGEFGAEAGMLGDVDVGRVAGWGSHCGVGDRAGYECRKLEGRSCKV